LSLCHFVLDSFGIRSQIILFLFSHFQSSCSSFYSHRVLLRGFMILLFRLPFLFFVRPISTSHFLKVLMVLSHLALDWLILQLIVTSIYYSFFRTNLVVSIRVCVILYSSLLTLGLKFCWAHYHDFRVFYLVSTVVVFLLLFYDSAILFVLFVVGKLHQLIFWKFLFWPYLIWDLTHFVVVC